MGERLITTVRQVDWTFRYIMAQDAAHVAEKGDQ